MTTDTALLDGVLLDADELDTTLGWTLTADGLCRGDECVVVPERSVLDADGAVDVRVAADLLDRPWVLDEGSGMLAVGASRARRRAALVDLRAPDFTLPDLDGTAHSLSDHRSKKRLLVAFSSW